ncbi:helix-turn-helix domain-containing protein [Actibacterium sp. D379-3]
MIGRKQPPVAAEAEQGPKGFDAFELRLGDIMRGERATLGKSLLDVQRELKIKATYIAAIENADPTAFETPGFIAGYVRSYARYLGMEPEWAYGKFCHEGNFATVHGMDKAASAAKPAPGAPRKPATADPLADPNASFVPRGEALLSRLEPGAVGSSLVLLALIGLLGFGGWSVLKEIQQVKLTPVDQAPGVIAEVDPLSGAGAMELAVNETAGMALPSAEALDRLYRPRPLDVPEMIARDGPIATLEPGGLSALAAIPETPRIATVSPAETAAPEDRDAPVRVVADTAPEIVLFATRPAWVRVSAADGSVLLEKILDAGERYALPRTEEPPLLRTGYAGAVYFAVNGQAYGPAGEGGSVVKNVVLGADALSQTYQIADLTQNPDLASMVAQLSQPIGAD